MQNAQIPPSSFFPRAIIAENDVMLYGISLGSVGVSFASSAQLLVPPQPPECPGSVGGREVLACVGTAQH